MQFMFEEQRIAIFCTMGKHWIENCPFFSNPNCIVMLTLFSYLAIIKLGYEVLLYPLKFPNPSQIDNALFKYFKFFKKWAVF